MLVSRSTPFIFQQIILPYLSAQAFSPTSAIGFASRTSSTPVTSSSAHRRSFSSTSSQSRPPIGFIETTRQEGTGNQWQPFSGPNLGGPSTRRRAREYLGLEGDDRPRGLGEASRVRDTGEREGEAYKRTAAMALERIIKSHLSPESSLSSEAFSLDGSRSTRGKGKAKEAVLSVGEAGSAEQIPLGRDDGSPKRQPSRDTSSSNKANLTSLSTVDAIEAPSPTISSTSATTTIPTDLPFPPLIHQLLQGRQFRLATLHILNLPLYALDPALVQRVAAYMERHGAGQAAQRLRRGKIPTPIEKGLMTNDEHDRLPDDYWTLLRHYRAIRTLDDVERYIPDIGLDRRAQFTAFCNIQLANLISTANATSSKGIPPKSFPRPNASLRQLRALLTRIHKLEQHRGFVPDRVTANIILSCWIQCSLAPRQEGTRIVRTTKSHHDQEGGGAWKISPRHTSPAQGMFGSAELRKIFDTVSRLIDRQALLEGGGGISYSRHVKPFVRIFGRGFAELGDGQGRRMLSKWDQQVGEVLREAKGRRGGDDPQKAAETPGVQRLKK